jgi:error-prone DNA polymerase
LARAIRVGLAQVQGVSGAAINSILAARKQGPFESVADFWARTRVQRPSVENLIRCGGLDAFGPRRTLLWQFRMLARSKGGAVQLRLFDEQGPPPLRPHTLREETSLQLSLLGISLKCHPTYFCRELLVKMEVTPSDRLHEIAHGSRVKVAGICIARMRPPTKSGQTVIFITLEDETGLSEVTVFERVYRQYGPVIFSHHALLVEGELQTEGRYGVTILAESISPLPL